MLLDQLQAWAKLHARFRFIPVVGSRYSSNVRTHMEEPSLPEGFETLAHPRCVEMARDLQRKLWNCKSEDEREAVQGAHLEEHKAELASLRPVAELGWVNWHTIKKHAFPP